MQTTLADTTPDLDGEDELRVLLVSALEEEVGLLDGLRKIFVVQREALAEGDPRALDDGVFAATRVMRTMEEARRRRRRLTTNLLGSDVDFDELDTILTGPLNRSVRAGQDQVRAAAARLRREVALLRRILRVALSDNRRYLDILLGEGPSAGATSGGYCEVTAPAPVQSGVVLDRTV
jgi:FlgN protein